MDRFVWVPVDPHQSQIEAGAKGIASWEDGAEWPGSWLPIQVLRMRLDARKAYRAMVAENPALSELPREEVIALRDYLLAEAARCDAELGKVLARSGDPSTATECS